MSLFGPDSPDPLVARRPGRAAWRIVVPLGLDLLEILESAAHHQLARSRGAGQVLDGIMKLEQQRVGQLAQRLETLLGAGLLDAGDARLAHDGDRPGEDDQAKTAATASASLWRLTNLPAR